MRKINLFAGPGAGKSSVQSELYALLKRHHYSVEMAREAAKMKIYEGVDISTQEMQFIIFGEQVAIERILRLGNLSIVIADSPLLLNAFFAENESFKQISLDLAGSEDLNFWITRYSGENFEADGRRHDFQESLKIDKKLKDYLIEAKVKLVDLDGTSEEKAKEIFRLIEEGYVNE